ncbi:MAG: hypothetical protein K2J93_02575, partial [Anaeroplasmataceae bacterium]|nr:hypothetical protein [Anaeroplasmataceae bacterium]
YLKDKLGKDYKYTKARYDLIYKGAIEVYNKNLIENLSEEIALEKVREFIDLEVSKLKPKSKLFFPMLVSFGALLVASIECVLFSIDFTSILYELFSMTIIFSILFIYVSLFKKNKSKWRYSCFIFIGSWFLSFLWMFITEPSLIGTVTDTSFSTSFIFPCVFKLKITNFQNVHYENGIYFNWIISFISSIIFIILFYKELSQKKRAD